MMWFAELMEIIDQLTGLGDYSYLAAGAIVIFLVMWIVSIFRNN